MVCILYGQGSTCIIKPVKPEEIKTDKEKAINREIKKVKNDSVITMVAFVFDLNFKYSFKRFRDYKFMDKIYEKLNNKQIFKYYIDKAKEYIERMC